MHNGHRPIRAWGVPCCVKDHWDQVELSSFFDQRYAGLSVWSVEDVYFGNKNILRNPKNKGTSLQSLIKKRFPLHILKFRFSSNPFLAFPDTVETFSHHALMVNINRLERLTNFDAFFGRFDINLTWVRWLTGYFFALRLPFSTQKILAEKWLV